MRNVHPNLQAAGVALVAISVDSVYSHLAFAEQMEGLPYPLAADFERKVVTEWGVRRDDVAGYSGMANRSLFVLDRQGIVRWRWVRSKEQPLPDGKQVLEAALAVAETS